MQDSISNARVLSVLVRKAVLVASAVLIAGCEVSAPGTIRVDPAARPDDGGHEPTLDEEPADLRAASLRHVIQRRVAPLGIDVTVIKTPARVIAYGSDGRSYELPELQRMAEEAVRAERGAMTHRLVDALEQSRDRGRTLPVALAYHAPPVDDAVRDALHSADPAQRELANQQLADHLLAHRRALLEALAELGASDVFEARYAPLLAAAVPTSGIESIARLPEVTWMTLESDGATARVGTAAGDVDPIVATGIWEHFNDLGSGSGLYGSGQKVGVLEAFSYNDDYGTSCGLNEDHEAFSELAGLHYSQDPPTNCTDDDDCGLLLGGVPGCTCVNNRCVRDHMQWVSSMIAASDDGQPRGAAQVEMYIPNSYRICTFSGTAQALDYLSDHDVRTISVTHQCVDPEDDWPMEHYARWNDMAIFRAAGNHSDESTGEGGEVAETWCSSTMNVNCVGGADSFGSMSCFSRSLNPPETDREEPDFVVLGGQDSRCAGFDERLCMAAHDMGPEDWTAHDGTSYSAPLAAAMAVLLREHCQEWGHLSALLLRAILRTDAHASNPDGLLRYSTPAISDYRDGAGELQTGALLARCGGEVPPGGPLVHEGEQTVDLTSGMPMPDGSSTFAQGEPRETGGDPYEPLDYADPTDGRRVGLPIIGWEVPIGGRIRATISWNACVPPLEAPHPGNIPFVAPDFDLFLLRKDGDQAVYVFGSQSIDDNNEGFDVVIQEEDGDGEYELWISWIDGATGCEGSSTEPFAWATAAWTGN